MASGYLMLMAVDSVQMSYAASFIIGMGYCAGGLVPVSILITTGFAEKRVFARGLAMCGSGAATIIAPTILSGMIARPVSYTHLDVYKRQGYPIWQ